MELFSGNDRVIKHKTMSLKKYFPKTKSNHDCNYIHYQDPSFQSKFKGVVLKKDYHIYSLFCRRLRDKSTPQPRKVFSQSNSPNKIFISNRDFQLSASATRYFDPFKPSGDISLYSNMNNNEWSMKINSNPRTTKYSSVKNERCSAANKYKSNFALPIIPKAMLIGKQSVIKNEYLISKLSFFSK